jgi:hypothetical protein
VNKTDGDPQRRGGAYPPKARKRRSDATTATRQIPEGKLARGIRRSALRLRDLSYGKDGKLHIAGGPGPASAEQKKREEAHRQAMRRKPAVELAKEG